MNKEFWEAVESELSDYGQRLDHHPENYNKVLLIDDQADEHELVELRKAGRYIEISFFKGMISIYHQDAFGPEDVETDLMEFKVEFTEFAPDDPKRIQTYIGSENPYVAASMLYAGW